MSGINGGEWPELERILKPKQPPAVPFVLRWWPIIAFLVAWTSIIVTGFYQLQTAQNLTETRVVGIELSAKAHEERSRSERAELLSEIHELRQDVKLLLMRSGVK